MPEIIDPTLLLTPSEPAAFEVVNGDCPSHLIIICDHAANLIPKGLNNLGLSFAQLKEHIAWDPGAAQVARLLAERLQAPLVLSQYSRLLIDCNRPLQSEELIPQQSAGVIIPGNLGLSQSERSARIEQFFVPYHRAIAQLITQRKQLGGPFLPRILLSVHSFTPELNQLVRPWQIGISARRDDRLARGIVQQFTQIPELKVGFNQPYAIDDLFDYSLPVHGEAEALHNAMIEIRQDELQTLQQASVWAQRIAKVYRLLEADFCTTEN
jgi:predicted N-formylglutamate amidohydrolase